MGICRFKNYSGVRKIIIIVAPDKYFYNKKWHGSYSLDWAQYNVAMVIIWIEIYRFLSPFVRDGEERIGETSRSRFPRKWIFSSSSDWNCFGPRIGSNCGPWDEGCTGSIPGDGCSSFSVGWSVWGGRRVIGIQSNIAEKLFTNETPLSANVPLLHQEGRDWVRMRSGELWTRTLT